MKRKKQTNINSICPYLGLKDDQETVLGFASVGNYCHKAFPKSAINLNHQKSVCLTKEYMLCEVFLKKEAAKMPASLKAGTVWPNARLFFVWGIFILGLLVAVIGGIKLWLRSGLAFSEPIQTPVLSSNKENLVGENMTVTRTETIANIQTVISTKIIVSGTPMGICDPPGSWIPYLVKPTDSLVRLSAIYQVTIFELQQANCMGESIMVRPGDYIFVPGTTPTSTVSPTPTVTITKTRRPQPIVIWTSTSPPRNNEPGPPTDTVVPQQPTEVPPTDVPPTAVPPTAVPPTEEPTPTPPPI